MSNNKAILADRFIGGVDGDGQLSAEEGAQLQHANATAANGGRV
jgi:hypothetical protein